MTELPANDAFERALWAIRHHPSAIVCDIDGTISAIAPTPDAAKLAPGAREALIRLSSHVELVAVVTGRSAIDGSTILGVSDALVVGNHGLEWIQGGEHVIHPEALQFEGRLADVMTAIAELTAGDPRLHGAVVENKRLSGSVHYRLTPNPDVAYTVLLDAAKELGLRNNLRVSEGRMVVEIRPPVDVNKGAALQRIVEERILMGMVFFGDDVTDVDGFRVLRMLRDTRNFAGLSVAVADPEARPEVIAAADTSIDGVASCVGLLGRLADELDRVKG
jgi:trehalose 6-phosphate phosphatase